MTLRPPTVRCLILLAVLMLATGSSSRAQVLNLFDLIAPSDPPGFAALPIAAAQTARLNVVCFEHQVGLLPPNPCRGEVMWHDAAGNLIKRGTYALEPGQSAFLQVSFNEIASPGATGLIQPCIIPARGGRAIPSAEIFDNATGRVRHFANPVTPRMSRLSNGRDPGGISGFDPQPDPPGFGLVTVAADQLVRLQVACFDHPVLFLPPNPCRGELMLHNAAGELLRSERYEIAPGQTAAVEFRGTRLPGDTTPGAHVGIVPCVLPAPGGRALPAVQVIDPTGATALVITPAAVRMSDFQRR